MACAALSFSRNPYEDRLSWTIPLAAFTPISTHSLDRKHTSSNSPMYGRMIVQSICQCIINVKLIVIALRGM